VLSYLVAYYEPTIVSASDNSGNIYVASKLGLKINQELSK